MNIRHLSTLLFAGLVLVLNLIDAVFTLVYVQSGLATEANPLMDQALQVGPVAFVVVKLSLVSAGVALLWRLRHRIAATVGLVGMTVAYLAVAFYHLQHAHHLVAHAMP